MSSVEDSESTRIFDPGRGPFLDRLAEFIADASRVQADLALLCIRVSDLVRIQHDRGYRVGDRLLSGVYNRLAQIARDQDHLTWIGDGKFALVLRQAMGEGHAILAANKIQRGFSAPLEVDGAEISTPLAVGVTLLSVEEGDAEGLLKQAEIALIQPRLSGKLRCEQAETPEAEPGGELAEASRDQDRKRTGFCLHGIGA